MKDTPIYDQCLLDHYGTVARDTVRTGLYALLVACTTCGATVNQPCRTTTCGVPTRDHRARRRWAR